MTKEQISAINRDRVVGWGGDLTEHHATAIICLGVGQDQNAGELHVCVIEALTVPMVIGFLRKMADNLEHLEAQKS